MDSGHNIHYCLLINKIIMSSNESRDKILLQTCKVKDIAIYTHWGRAIILLYYVQFWAEFVMYSNIMTLYSVTNYDDDGEGRLISVVVTVEEGCWRSGRLLQSASSSLPSCKILALCILVHNIMRLKYLLTGRLVLTHTLAKNLKIMQIQNTEPGSRQRV
jgi:hypothetical protein